MENADKWFAIVNPVAGSGRGLADWPQISKLLRDNHIVPEYAFTERKYHAIELAVEAVNNGFRKLIVVGGDGTIHEAVNGLFIQKAVPTQDVLLSVIAVGTGNDWIRMFGIPRKYSEAIRAIVEGHSFLQDVGMISYYQSSYRQTRYMANVAGDSTQRSTGATTTSKKRANGVNGFTCGVPSKRSCGTTPPA